MTLIEVPWEDVERAIGADVSAILAREGWKVMRDEPTPAERLRETVQAEPRPGRPPRRGDGGVAVS